MAETAACAICGAEVPRSERYSLLVCTACVAEARDEHGRPLRFANESLLGTGFAAEAQGADGAWHRLEGDEARCVIRGRACVAREHYFGGVVVQVDVTPPSTGSVTPVT